MQGFDDAKRIRSNSWNVTAVNIGGFNATDQKPVFAVPSLFPEGYTGVEIKDVVLVSDTATASSASDKKYALQIVNQTQTLNLLATAVDTYATAEIAVDTPWRITPDQNADVGAGDVLELSITKTGSPTDLNSAEVTLYVLWRWT